MSNKTTTNKKSGSFQILDDVATTSDVDIARQVGETTVENPLAENDASTVDQEIPVSANELATPSPTNEVIVPTVPAGEITPSLSASEVISSPDALAPEVSPQITEDEPIKVNSDDQLKPPETTVANPVTDSAETAESPSADLIESVEPVIEQATTELSVSENDVERYHKIQDAIKTGQFSNAERTVTDERTKKTVGTSLT